MSHLDISSLHTGLEAGEQENQCGNILSFLYGGTHTRTYTHAHTHTQHAGRHMSDSVATEKKAKSPKEKLLSSTVSLSAPLALSLLSHSWLAGAHLYIFLLLQFRLICRTIVPGPALLLLPPLAAFMFFRYLIDFTFRWRASTCCVSNVAHLTPPLFLLLSFFIFVFFLVSFLKYFPPAGWRAECVVSIKINQKLLYTRLV